MPAASAADTWISNMRGPISIKLSHVAQEFCNH
jgi:hypothetical protein